MLSTIRTNACRRSWWPTAKPLRLTVRWAQSFQAVAGLRRSLSTVELVVADGGPASAIVAQRQWPVECLNEAPTADALLAAIH